MRKTRLLTLIACLAMLGLSGCRDRGQERVGADWIGTSLKDRARLRPADPQWADFIRSRDLETLGSLPDLEAELDPLPDGADAGPITPVTPSELSAAAASGPATVELLVASARGLLRLGRTDDALAALRRASSRDAENLDVQLLLGRALDRLGRSGDAADAFAAALKIDPGNDDAQYGRALSLIRLNKIGDAQQLLEALSKSRGEDANVQRLLALYKEHAGDPQGALDALRKAATLASESSTQRILGNAAARRGEYADAVIALRKAVNEAPEDADLQLQLGTALGYTGDFAGAEQALVEAVRLRPGNGTGWRNLAAALEHQGDAEGAAKAYESLLKEDKTPYDRNEVRSRIQQLREAGLMKPDTGTAAPAAVPTDAPSPAGDADGGR